MSEPRAPSVQTILERAPVGRNTFYAHFRDSEEALDEARWQGKLALDAALSRRAEGIHTPREKLRALVAAWVEVAHERADFVAALFLLGETRPGPLAAARAALERALGPILREARGAGTIGSPPDDLRMQIVLGAFESAARLAVEGRDRRRIAEVLADVVLRALR